MPAAAAPQVFPPVDPYKTGALRSGGFAYTSVVPGSAPLTSSGGAGHPPIATGAKGVKSADNHGAVRGQSKRAAAKTLPRRDRITASKIRCTNKPWVCRSRCVDAFVCPAASAFELPQLVTVSPPSCRRVLFFILRTRETARKRWTPGKSSGLGANSEDRLNKNRRTRLHRYGRVYNESRMRSHILFHIKPLPRITARTSFQANSANIWILPR